MKPNYIDNKGNYINNENLSLREIYERGIEEGKKRCSYPAIIRVKEMTDENKQRFLKEWKKASERGLVLTSASEIEVIRCNTLGAEDLINYLWTHPACDFSKCDICWADTCMVIREWFDKFEPQEVKHEDLSDNSIQE